MIAQKSDFLKNEFISLLEKLEKEQKGIWGKMNAQQMVEHVANFFKVSIEKIRFPLTTLPEHLPKYKEFLWSDKEFQQNTKAPVLPEEPLLLQHSNMQHAIADLKNSVADFFIFFEKDPSRKTLHPAFGELNLEEWIQLHHKHVTHHLKQFGFLNPSSPL